MDIRDYLTNMLEHGAYYPTGSEQMLKSISYCQAEFVKHRLEIRNGTAGGNGPGQNNQ